MGPAGDLHKKARVPWRRARVPLPLDPMTTGRARAIYTRLSRTGLEGRDRLTARFVMGANHYLLFAIAAAIPFVAVLAVMSRGALWPAALVHAALVAVWLVCLWLNSRGLTDTAAVVSLAAPLVAYAVQSWLLSTRAGFMLPMLMASAVSFVIMAPRMAPWRFALTLASSAAVTWSFLDSRFSQPHLDATPAHVDMLLVANVALATVVVGSTSWMNDHYFTRERKRAESQLSSAQHQARTDALTQLANRRGMVEALASAPREKPYAIALIDLDRFKSVNDTLGHARGDVVLADVARVLEEQVGDRGVVSRWGGEEFLVLINDSRLTSAVATIERARRTVEAAVSTAGDGGAAVTFSAGLAAASAGFPWEITVRVADALLYEAKDAGRNRVRYAQVRADVDGWDL